MKYVAPEFATLAIETEDIILASTEQGGSQGGASDNVTTPDEEL